MRQTLPFSLTLFVAVSIGVAQITRPTTDVLGAHLNYGRGCAACHAPHSGSLGTGRSSDAAWGTMPLWGANMSARFDNTITTSGGRFVEILPPDSPDVAGMLTCLGCHDGNYASQAMMKNRVYEVLPSAYATANSIPTLLGGGLSSSYLNYHPVGLEAVINCGGTNWDCTLTNGMVRMNGTMSTQFVANYGFFLKPESYNNSAVIVCTTCHDPHSMNVAMISKERSGLPAGTYATMFFLRAPYNPNDTNPLSNQTAQFCRQCHGDKSNEMNGSSARTVF